MPGTPDRWSLPPATESAGARAQSSRVLRPAQMDPPPRHARGLRMVEEESNRATPESCVSVQYRDTGVLCFEPRFVAGISVSVGAYRESYGR